ncbi:MAG: flavodoxin domain-containing protein, partial [bacterium]|nr:flavodoxin domain-containing protein [bacterium]
LPQLIDLVGPEKVFASPMGVRALNKHFRLEKEIVPVKDGETLSLGNRTLSFLETRMIHWPDSMISYLADEKLLFSQDGFGMHLASSERFADEIPDEVLEWEAAKYYANILLPFSPRVLKLLKRVTDLGLEFDIIAPDHGPIWREDPGTIVGLYADWAVQVPKNKAVIVYDTMWGSTEKMARALCDGLAQGGTEVKLMKLRSSHRSDVATEVLDAGALLVGSPTMNNNIFPTVADVLTYLKGLKPQNKIGAAFGSYGWSGESVKQVEAVLREMKVELVSESLKTLYVPGDEELKRCFELGQTVAEKLADQLEDGT